MQGCARLRTGDVLTCETISPIVEDVFNEGVCTNAVEGLYRIWIVVLASGVATYTGLLLMPFAIAAINQQWDAKGGES